MLDKFGPRYIRLKTAQMMVQVARLAPNDCVVTERAKGAQNPEKCDRSV
jgi:hypothetical protein